VTDLFMLGGPHDAGYLEEAPRALQPSERLDIRLDEEKGRPGPPPPLSETDWPRERRDKALRKYGAAYAIGGVAQVARELGLNAAAPIAEESHRAVFLAWPRPLAKAFGIAEEDSSTRVAELLRRCFELVADRLVEAEEERVHLCRHIGTRLTAPQ